MTGRTDHYHCSIQVYPGMLRQAIDFCCHPLNFTERLVLRIGKSTAALTRSIIRQCPKRRVGGVFGTHLLQTGSEDSPHATGYLGCQ